MMKELIEKLKNFLFIRKQAYEQVFNPESIFVQRVIADLSKFCRDKKTTFHSDARLSALLEGRREVLLRIMYHSKLDNEQFWKMYGREDLEKL